MMTKAEFKAACDAAHERFRHDDAALAAAIAEVTEFLEEQVKKRGKAKARAAFYKMMKRRPDLSAAVTRHAIGTLIDEEFAKRLPRPN